MDYNPADELYSIPMATFEEGVVSEKEEALVNSFFQSQRSSALE